MTTPTDLRPLMDRAMSPRATNTVRTDAGLPPAPTPTTTPEPAKGVWLAFYWGNDGPAVDRIFADEVDALRYVNGTSSYTAKFVAFDRDVDEALR